MKLTSFSSVWKSRQKHDHCFSVKLTFFTKEVTKELIQRKYLSVIAFLVNFHNTVLSQEKKFREINVHSDLKNVKS